MLLYNDGKYAIRKRPDKGLLAGMWELPGVEGKLCESEVKELLRAKWSMPVVVIHPLGETKHIFSHVEWHMTGYLVRVDGEFPTLQGGEPFDGLQMVSLHDLEEIYSLPAAFEAYRPGKIVQSDLRLNVIVR